MSAGGLRPELAAIADMIRPGTRVLDVGCGEGALLEHLVQAKGVDGRGIEISQQNVNACAILAPRVDGMRPGLRAQLPVPTAPDRANRRAQAPPRQPE